jgi:hypothetical protein
LNLPFKNNKKRHIANPSLTLKIKKTKFKTSSSNFKQMKKKTFLIIPGNLDLSAGANGKQDPWLSPPWIDAQ